MTPRRLPRRLLRLLLSSRQNDETIDFMDVCRACAARPYAVLKALHLLASAGLVDPIRLRLTFEGLAVATALSRARPDSSAGTPGPVSTQAGPPSSRCAA